MNPMPETTSTADLAQIESELKGKTLQIYWYMLRTPGSQVGVREIQRQLHLSSPSVAAHHLEKLVSLGLVDKSRIGEYYITQEVKVGLLRFFTRLGRFLVPRYLFYSIWFTTMLITYIILYPTILYPHDFSIHNIVAVMFGTLATIILWLETARLWRQKPF
jgi:predicted DNA-binding transcriptional regulator